MTGKRWLLRREAFTSKMRGSLVFSPVLSIWEGWVPQAGLTWWDSIVWNCWNFFWLGLVGEEAFDWGSCKAWSCSIKSFWHLSGKVGKYVSGLVLNAHPPSHFSLLLLRRIRWGEQESVFDLESLGSLFKVLSNDFQLFLILGTPNLAGKEVQTW